MSMQVVNAPATFSFRPLSALAGGLRRWFAYRDTAGALSGLSRRELDDIGVDTSVDEFAWRVATDVARRD